MPDFERVSRSLELHVCRDDMERAFVRGRHAGESKARKQIAIIFLLCVIISSIIYVWAR